MKVSPKLYVKLLKSEEYVKYLLFKDGKCFVDYKSLPKKHYLEICGDSIDGLLFSQKLNKNKDDFILIEPEYK